MKSPWGPRLGAETNLAVLGLSTEDRAGDHFWQEAV